MKPLTCATCLGTLRYVDTEANGDTSYVCTRCGDETYGSVLCTCTADEPPHGRSK